MTPSPAHSSSAQSPSASSSSAPSPSTPASSTSSAPSSAPASSTLSSFPRRTWAWLRGVHSAHPWISDGVLWALPVTWLGVSSALEMVWVDTRTGVPMWARIAIVVLTTAPLVLRRVHPLLSSILIALACSAAVLTDLGPTVAIIAVPLTVFSTASWGSRTQSRIVLVLGIVGALVLGLWSFTLTLQASLGPGAQPIEGSDYIALATVVALCAAIVLSAWLLGILAHRRRAAVQDVHERNRLLEKERDSESRLAADAERMRIAREMHDIIAHSLSVVIAQADGGRYAAKNNPDAAADALTTIAQTGRDALAQTRNLLGVLRSETHTDGTTSPLPGLLDVPALLSDVRAAGLAVSIDGFDAVPGTGVSTAEAVAGRLPDGAGLAVYRIVQEALTNVLKHAGSGARARVSLTASDHDLAIRVRDDGGPSSARTTDSRTSDSGTPDSGAGAGSGILGMRERATLYGGTLEASPLPGAEHGFGVTARFPLVTPRTPATPPSGPAARTTPAVAPAADAGSTPTTAEEPTP